MKKKFSLLNIFLCFLTIASCETNDPEGEVTIPYTITSYFLGNEKDKVTNSKGGIVMMGGNRENDEAMKWFLDRANGGDVLILRTSGSDGYQTYLFKELGFVVNSVETIVFHDQTTSEYVKNKIDRAEAIWFAGGNQKKYLDYWKDNYIQEALQRAINRGAVIGGTSAGMAILGEYIWDGEKIQTDFLRISFMQNIITDTHYDSRNRMSRHLEFISTIEGKGIAAEDYTAICIYPDGKTFVYGDDAEHDYAYFIKEDLSYVKIKGSSNGTFALDLNDW